LILGQYLKSHNFLFVIFELHDDWFDIFALRLPFTKALLGIWVEVLFLLVLKSLVVEGLMLLIDVIFLSFDVFITCLLFNVVGQFDSSLSLFFSFLLFGNSKFFISELPELCELHFFLLAFSNLSILSIDLVLSTLFDSAFHFSSSNIFFFK